jgi:hypothetical protein
MSHGVSSITVDKIDMRRCGPLRRSLDHALFSPTIISSTVGDKDRCRQFPRLILRMVLHESYTRYWSDRYRRPPGCLSIGRHGHASPRDGAQPRRGRLPPQVEVVRGDLTLPETLDGCFDGIDTVFLMRTAPPAAVATALARITKHARRIVYLSAPLKTAHPLFQQPNPLRAMFEQIERLIDSSGHSCDLECSPPTP